MAYAAGDKGMLTPLIQPKPPQVLIKNLQLFSDLWFLMISHDFSWFLMISHDFSRFFSWFLMISHDFSWFLMISPDFSWFFLISGFCYKSPFASECSWKKRSSHQGKNRSSLYCVQTSSFLFVEMWRVCKSSKIKHPGGSGGLCPLDQRETQARYPFFRIFYFCQITLLFFSI